MSRKIKIYESKNDLKLTIIRKVIEIVNRNTVKTKTMRLSHFLSPYNMSIPTPI